MFARVLFSYGQLKQKKYFGWREASLDESDEAGEEDNAGSARIESPLKEAIGLGPQFVVANNNLEVLLGCHRDRELVDGAGVVVHCLDEEDDQKAKNQLDKEFGEKLHYSVVDFDRVLRIYI